MKFYICGICVKLIDRRKDGVDVESVITQLESITNRNQSVYLAGEQSSNVNKVAGSNMSEKSKSKRSGVSSTSSARKAAILAKNLKWKRQPCD